MAAAFPLPGLGAPMAAGLAGLPMQPPMGMPQPGMPMPGMAPQAPPPEPDPEPEVGIPEEEWPELFTRLRGWFVSAR